MKNIKYEGHELSLLFPRMTAPELEELGTSIREHGLQEDIVLHEGKILDGLSRYTACLDIGVKPRFRNFGSRDTDGPSPTAFVNAHNLQRRHLKNASIRAALAAKLLPYFQAEAVQKGGGDTLGQAAKATGANRSYVASAAALGKEDPAALDAVAEGKVSLPDAVATAAAKKAEDKALKAANNKAVRDLKREHSAQVLELHGPDFATAYDKGVILKKLDELKLFHKQDPATQIQIAPLITRQYAVKSAIKMMTGDLSAEDSIATLIVRTIAHDELKKSKAFKVIIDGYAITVRKSVEGGD